MKILSISAKYYRTLEDITITFNRSYCTLSGKNNSGKSSIIRLLMNLLTKDYNRPYFLEDEDYVYKDDKTQWIKDEPDIEIDYILEMTKSDDLSLIKYIEKFATLSITSDSVSIRINLKMDSKDNIVYKIYVDNKEQMEDTSKEIIEKMKNSNVLFIHNSTLSNDEIFYGRRHGISMYEMFLSSDEQNAMKEAQKSVQHKINQLAKNHKKELNRFLGKLNDKYDVDFTTLDNGYTRRLPFSINLKDKNVEIPLNDWGSGTKNRTLILMSILQANKIKMSDPSQDKVTPIVIIEEPESFLHPSAQAEFGKILRELSDELEIQIIATTHSPYMLNQKKPNANILLCRECKKGQLFQTKIIDTSCNNWMAPFAEHLGINNNEFLSWNKVFISNNSKVLLVEGETDKEYFEYIREKKFGEKPLYDDIEIVAYNGKDTLKNTLLVKFVLSKFDKIFITYDLDASSEVKGYLSRLNLIENDDYVAVGENRPGKEAIEGLLPNRILSSVNSRETDLIMALGSADSSNRKSAKSALKKKYLEEFKNNSNYSVEELSGLLKLVKLINKKFK